MNGPLLESNPVIDRRGKQGRRGWIRERIARLVLPFAQLLTLIRFSRKRSLLLDKIISQAESK